MGTDKGNELVKGTDVTTLAVAVLAALVVPVSVSVTGQIVVEMAMISVVTWPFLAGQSLTSGAQDVMV